MELIKIENDIALLNPATSKKIAEFEKAMKELKEKQDELKKAILDEMEAKNIIKIDNDDFTITRILGTERETFDSKAFKEVHQDLYDEFVKFTPVKSSIRIKLKEKTEAEEKLEEIKKVIG